MNDHDGKERDKRYHNGDHVVYFVIPHTDHEKTHTTTKLLINRHL